MMYLAMKRRALFSALSFAVIASVSALSSPADARTLLAPPPPKSTVAVDRITMDARDVEVRTLLSLLFDETKQDYSLDTGVQGYLTLKVTDQSLDTLVRLVTRGNIVPLTVAQENKVWFIKSEKAPQPKEPIASLNVPPAPIIEARTIYEVPRRVAAIVLVPGHEGAILVNGPEDSPEARIRTVHVGDKVPSGLTGVEPLEVVSINVKGVTLAQAGTERIEFLVPLKTRYNPFTDKHVEKY